MKTPDEIKKGLDCCTDGNVICTQCPYYDLATDCSKVLRADYRALFQQLEAERDAAFKDINKNCYTCGVSAETIHEEPCNSCRRAGGNKENWEWRGVQKEVAE